MISIVIVSVRRPGSSDGCRLQWLIVVRAGVRPRLTKITSNNCKSTTESKRQTNRKKYSQSQSGLKRKSGRVSCQSEKAVGGSW